jgi:hypothetical protein
MKKFSYEAIRVNGFTFKGEIEAINKYHALEIVKTKFADLDAVKIDGSFEYIAEHAKHKYKKL